MTSCTSKVNSTREETQFEMFPLTVFQSVCMWCHFHWSFADTWGIKRVYPRKMRSNERSISLECKRIVQEAETINLMIKSSLEYYCGKARVLPLYFASRSLVGETLRKNHPKYHQRRPISTWKERPKSFHQWPAWYYEHFSEYEIAKKGKHTEKAWSFHCQKGLFL